LAEIEGWLNVDSSGFLQPLADAWFDQRNIRVSVLRLDRLDPLISGNKWFKLKLNLQEARKQGLNRIISFGGAFSNHIHALSAAGKRFDFDTVGVIRGEPQYADNPTLSDALENGMQLHFLNREQYRHKTDSEFIASLQKQYGPAYIVPEGGDNRFGVLGCGEIARLIPVYEGLDHHVYCASGTGCTLSGIVTGLAERQRERIFLHGISVLKDQGAIGLEVERWLKSMPFLGPGSCAGLLDWQIDERFHFGGYGKFDQVLVQLLDYARLQWHLPLDPVYTGKMLFGFLSMLNEGLIADGSQVTLIHSGGLQGLRGCAGRIDRLRGDAEGLSSLADLFKT
jgi:1-aminocyclopropane-1-carboxylate deaminase